MKPCLSKLARSLLKANFPHELLEIPRLLHPSARLGYIYQTNLFHAQISKRKIKTILAKRLVHAAYTYLSQKTELDARLIHIGADTHPPYLESALNVKDHAFLEEMLSDFYRYYWV
ncbi:MAG: hypothetical protein ACTSX9_02765 [Candidatus Njordarchaeales archaeon]